MTSEFAIQGTRIARGHCGNPDIFEALGGYKLQVALDLDPEARLAVVGASGVLRCEKIEVCHLVVRPGEVPATRDRGSRLHLIFECFLTPAQLHVANELRAGGDARFTVDAYLVVQTDGGPESCHMQRNLRVSQSDWLAKLADVGFMESFLVEVPVPQTVASARLGDAVAALQAAREHLAAKGTDAVLVQLKSLADDLDTALGRASFGAVDGLVKKKGDVSTWDTKDRMLVVRWALGRLVRNAGHGGQAREIEVSDAAAEAAFTMFCGLARWCLVQGTNDESETG